MKNLSLIILLFSLIACKNQNGLGGEKKPDFKLTAYSEVSNGKNKTRRFELLQHALFAKLTNTKSFTDQQKEELNSLASYSNQTYEKDFVKLIVISSEEEKVFYVPATYSKKFLVDNLDYFATNEELKFWMGEEFKVGTTAYLLLTTPDLLLKNEVKFTEKTVTKIVNSELKMGNISKYQQVDLKIRGFESSQIEKDKTYYRVTSNRNCDRCHCSLGYSAPSEEYSKFSEIDMDEMKLDLKINGLKLESLNKNYSFNFYNQEDQNEIELSFLKNSQVSYQVISNEISGGMGCNGVSKIFTVERNTNYQYEIVAVIKGSDLKIQKIEYLMENEKI